MFLLCLLDYDYLLYVYLVLFDIYVFTTTSRKVMIYAPLEEQPKQNLTREEMTEVYA